MRAIPHSKGRAKRRTVLAALIATHNLDLARRLDRVVAIEDGRLKPG